MGAVRRLLTVDTLTLAPPVGAALVSVTVQELEAFEPRLVGLQASEETATGATSPMFAVAELLLKVAVTVAVWSLEMAVVAALKMAVVAAAATVTETGTVSAVLLLLRVTLAPPVGAAFDNMTVQELDAFCPRLVGLQATEETLAGATSPTLAVAELPL